jgi:hypothetical protein
MHVAQPRQRRSHSGMTRAGWRSMRGSATTRAAARSRWGRGNQMRGVCTTCTGMCMSGALIGIGSIRAMCLGSLGASPRPTLKVLEAALTGCCVAGVGSTTPSSVVRRPATSTPPSTASATSGFVSRGLFEFPVPIFHRSSSLLPSLSLVNRARLRITDHQEHTANARRVPTLVGIAGRAIDLLASNTTSPVASSRRLNTRSSTASLSAQARDRPISEPNSTGVACATPSRPRSPRRTADR